jgi:hypothetical protein
MRDYPNLKFEISIADLKSGIASLKSGNFFSTLPALSTHCPTVFAAIHVASPFLLFARVRE